MLDAVNLSLRMQQAAMASALCATGLVAANWMRLMKGEHALFGHHEHRRSDELHARKDYIPKGPQWTDHYGKRSHDVDVEHMR